MQFYIGRSGKASKEVREGSFCVPGGRAFQAVATARKNVLRWEDPWHFAGTAMRPAWLEKSEQRAGCENCAGFWKGLAFPLIWEVTEE